MDASEFLESEECQKNCYILMFRKVNLCDTQDILGSLSQLMSTPEDSGSAPRVTRRKLLPDVRF